MKSNGYAALTATSPLVPFKFDRRELKPHDIHIEILFCGVCHSDIHMARNEWGGTSIYPMVPGHEIVGKVKKVRSTASSFKVGDLVAVGVFVDSCRSCPNCKAGEEQYCDVGFVGTYNAPDPDTGKVTYGGYSNQIVVDENYVLPIPKKFTEKQLPGVAPLLCAGVTTYSPLRHWKVSKGSTVGVVGLGGLGHMAVKLAHAMGAHVVVFTTSPKKVDDAKRLGAHEVVISKDKEAMEKQLGRFDFILDAVAASHDLDQYTQLLKVNGTLCLVGIPEKPHPTPTFQNLIFRRRSIAGSLIGSLKENREMLEFCADHGITADVEVIPIQKINEAFDRTVKGDVKYRFVIDMSSLKEL